MLIIPLRSLSESNDNNDAAVTSSPTFAPSSARTSSNPVVFKPAGVADEVRGSAVPGSAAADEADDAKVSTKGRGAWVIRISCVTCCNRLRVVTPLLSCGSGRVLTAVVPIATNTSCTAIVPKCSFVFEIRWTRMSASPIGSIKSNPNLFPTKIVS